MHITSPYSKTRQSWLKGQLHCHSTNSDGQQHPHDVFKDYEGLGFDFVGLTDHSTIPSVEDLAYDGKLVPISSTEYRGAGADSEIGIIGISNRLEPGVSLCDTHRLAIESGGFTSFNHPNWHIHHWPIYQMLGFEGCNALEIYNAVGDWLEGPSEATDKWDRLLTCGYRIWGTATDDAHTPAHRNRGWVMVSAEKDEVSIVEALKKGDFYSSSGVVISAISVEDGELCVETENADELRFFCDRGRMCHRQEGNTASYRPKNEDIYVRVEAYGKGTQKAWTNPVFVESERSGELSNEFREWYLSPAQRQTRAGLK